MKTIYVGENAVEERYQGCCEGGGVKREYAYVQHRLEIMSQFLLDRIPHGVIQRQRYFSLERVYLLRIQCLPTKRGDYAG